MTLLTLLASGAVGPKTLWDPTIIGILAVAAGVFLFMGSTYLLLATNVGARLGFLVALAGLSGMMVILSTLWLTTNTPLNSPKGREGKWLVKEVLSDPTKSMYPTVRDIGSQEVLPADKAATIKPFVDAALVTVTPPANETPPEQPFAKYTSASYYLTERPVDKNGDPLVPGEEPWGTRTIGGGSKAIFWHNPWYAVVEFCDVKTKPDNKYLALGEVPDAVCKPGAPHQYAVLLRDYGSLRLPPAMYLVGSLALFLMSLFGLHNYEKDQRARKAAALVPAKA